MPMTFRTAVGAVVALLLAGCASTEPYAEVTGERFDAKDVDDAELVIVGVDGRLDFSGRSTVMLEPGRHTLVMGVGPLLNGPGRSTTVEVSVEARACMRYHFLAEYDKVTAAGRLFKVVLKSTTPMPECLARFPGGTLAPAKRSG